MYTFHARQILHKRHRFYVGQSVIETEQVSASAREYKRISLLRGVRGRRSNPSRVRERNRGSREKRARNSRERKVTSTRSQEEAESRF